MLKSPGVEAESLKEWNRLTQKGTRRSPRRLSELADRFVLKALVNRNLFRGKSPETFPFPPAISKREMERFMEASYRPENTTVVIIGAVAPKRALELCGHHFGRWPKKSVSFRPYTPKSYEPVSCYLQVPTDQEAEIRIATKPLPFSKWGDDLFLSHELVKKWLRRDSGGERGQILEPTLADPAGEYSLLFTLNLRRGESVEERWGQLDRRLKKLFIHEPSLREIEEAKRRVDGESLMRHMTLAGSSDAFLERMARGDKFGTLYPQRVDRSPHPARIAGILQEWLDPTRLSVIVVGDKRGYDEIEGKDRFRLVTLTPAPTGREKEPVEFDSFYSDMARKTLRKARDFMCPGDESCGIHDIFREGMGTAFTNEGTRSISVREYIVCPDLYRIEIFTRTDALPEVVQIVSKETIRLFQKGTEIEIPEKLSDRILLEVEGDETCLLNSLENTSLSITFGGLEPSPSGLLQVIHVTRTSGTTIELLVTPGEGRMRKIRLTDKFSDLGPVTTERLLTDYKKINGFRVPTRRVNYLQGKKLSDIKFSSVKINSGISLEFFEDF
jgi:hypothetical protein